MRRPKHLYADRGYDHEVYRDKICRFRITPHIARRGTGHGSGLDVYRRVVEGAIALLHWFRRLRTRGETRDDIHRAFGAPRLRRHLPATNPYRTSLGVKAGDALEEMACSMRQNARASVGPAQPHSRDLSTSTSQPGANGSKPCSISQRTPSRLRNDHHARITSRSTSMP